VYPKCKSAESIYMHVDMNKGVSNQQKSMSIYSPVMEVCSTNAHVCRYAKKCVCEAKKYVHTLACTGRIVEAAAARGDRVPAPAADVLPASDALPGLLAKSWS